MFGELTYNWFCRKYNIDKLSFIEDIILKTAYIKALLSPFEEAIAVELIETLGYNIFGVKLNPADLKFSYGKDSTVIEYDGPLHYINNIAFDNYYS